MAELLCFTENSFSSLELPERNGAVVVEDDHRSIQVPLNHARIAGDTVYYARARPGPDDLSLLLAHDGFVFGRQLMETPDPAVSIEHFRITRQGGNYVLEDLDSMNGTYVNGRRIRRETLHFLDRIQCARCSLLWVGSFFLCSFRQHGPPVSAIPVIAAQQPDRTQSWKSLPGWTVMPDPLQETLESWTLQEPVKPQSLFLSCGSSLLMCAGSLLSAALLQVTQAGTADTVRTSLVMSLSMAGSFLAYGLISRRLTWKQQQAEADGSLEAYRQYLCGLQMQFRQLREQITKQQEKLAELWSNLDPVLFQSGLPVPCGWTETGLPVNIRESSFSWQHRRHPLFAFVKAVLEEAAIPVRTLRYEDMEAPVSGNPEALFAMTIWSQDPARVKWGGLQPVAGEYPHLWHDHSRVTGKLPGMAVYGLDIREDTGLSVTLTNLNSLRFCPPRPQTRPLSKVGTGPCYRVQIGTNQQQQPVFLDLLADGPHGLVAGTTGSGKSEAMTTLLTQLMKENDPAWFRFVILDFKGGSFAAPFSGLPHCAGIMTDLDETGMDALQLALEGELKRREQRMHDFQTLYPAQTPDFVTLNRFCPENPIPLLLVVADEFAQIREQYPMQMDFLQSLARVGRSLGICLLLSTQRPQGIVDAQILANTGYVLCFKVRDRFESQEVLQDGRAADLKGAGDGWFGPMRFQALYARRPVSAGGCLQKADGQILRQLPVRTWMEETLELAAKGRECCDLLLPGMPGSFDGPGLAQVLDAYAARLWILDPPLGSFTRILAPENRDQVLTVLRAVYPGMVLPTAGTAWFALHLQGERTVVLLDEDPALWIHPDVRLILIQTRPDRLTVSPDQTIVTGSAASLSLFGGFRNDVPFPTGRLEPDGLPLHFQDRLDPQDDMVLPDFDQPQDWAAVFTQPVLGLHQGEPVFWDGEPLAVYGNEAMVVAARLCQWRPDWPKPLVEPEDHTAPCSRLYTGGWKPRAWTLGLPSVPEPWILQKKSVCQGLIPLIHAQ